MKNNKNLEEFISKISHTGMSAKYQKLLPNILENYFDGKSLEESRERVKEKNRGLVNRTYDLMENLKIYSLKKTSATLSSVIKNPRETVKLGDHFFVAAIFEAMNSNKNSKKKISGFSKKYNLQAFMKDFLNEDFSKKENAIRDYREELSKVARDPEFYVFVMDNFLG